MNVRRLDNDTVLLEEGDVSIILYCPTPMSNEDVLDLCRAGAERLEKKAKLYRDYIKVLNNNRNL